MFLLVRMSVAVQLEAIPVISSISLISSGLHSFNEIIETMTRQYSCRSALLLNLQ